MPNIGNGRGVIDVNNTLYVTTASSGNVYAFDTSTSALSTAFTVSGASGLASITYDGSNFWIGDYSGTDKAFLYSPTGTLLKTINLSNCTGYCDGLTYIPVNGGELVSNRFDGAVGLSTYDIYDTNGNLVKSSFINTTNLSGMGCTNTTGIAWDGADFYVSCIFNARFAEYDANGDFVQIITNSNPQGYDNSGAGSLMEGLSANFAITIPNSSPEPASLLLIGIGLGTMALFKRLHNRKP